MPHGPDRVRQERDDVALLMPAAGLGGAAADAAGDVACDVACDKRLDVVLWALRPAGAGFA